MKSFIRICAAMSAMLSFLTACVEEKVQITALYLDVMELYLDIGESRQLVATVRPVDAPVTFTWITSDENVATVTSDGLVTLVSDGTATITAYYGSYRRNCVVSTAGLRLNKTTLFLTPGAKYDLIATLCPESPGAGFTWTSSDPRIATVNENGSVTYVAEGEVEIRVSHGAYSAACKVKCIGKNPWDFRNTLSKPLDNSLIYSKNVLLYAEGRIMQGFDIRSDEVMYYSQVSPDGKSVYLCRASAPGQNAKTEYMTLKYFGHGTQITLEETSEGDYIWLGSNATASGEEYGDNWSFSRVKFVPSAVYEHCAGETFFLNRNGEYDQQVAVDFAARRLLVGTRKSGKRNFWVFDLDEALALPKKSMSVTMTIEGLSVTNTVPDARDLSSCTPLANFSIDAGVNKDHEVYSYSHQGHEIVGDYIYFYEGNAMEDGSEYYSKAYLTTFTYGGEIIVDRTEVAAASDKSGLNTSGLTSKGYAEAESLKIKDGVLYLGFACHDGPGQKRYANVLKYEGQH